VKSNDVRPRPHVLRVDKETRNLAPFSQAEGQKVGLDLSAVVSSVNFADFVQLYRNVVPIHDIPNIPGIRGALLGPQDDSPLSDFIVDEGFRTARHGKLQKFQRLRDSSRNYEIALTSKVSK